MKYLAYLSLFVCLWLLSGCSEKKYSKLYEDATVLAFGDSLTFGTGVAPEESYPAYLNALLTQNVIKSGVPGEVSEKGLQRFERALDKHQPHLVILCHGGNDLLKRLDTQQTKSNIAQMIQIAHARDIQVLLIAVPELSLFGSAHPIFTELADEYPVGFIEDTLVDLQRNPQYKVDPIHLNGKGNQVLAEAIAEYLKAQGAI